MTHDSIVKGDNDIVHTYSRYFASYFKIGKWFSSIYVLKSFFDKGRKL